MKLKPCPWPTCRKDAAIALWDRLDDDLWAAHIHCQACGAGGPSMSAESAQQAVDAAAAAWNTRTEKAPC